MSLVLASELKDEDRVIFPQNRNMITHFEAGVFVVNYCIGMSTMSCSAWMDAGIATAWLMALVVGLLSYYIMVLFIKMAAKTRAPTLEDAWTLLISRKTVFIPAAFSVASAVVFIMLYLDYVTDEIAKIFAYFSPTATMSDYNWKLISVILAVVSFPITAPLQSFKGNLLLNYIGVLALVVILVLVFIMATKQIKADGVIEDAKYYFNSEGVMDTATAIFAMYLIQPFTYPSIGNIIGGTERSLKRMMGWSYSFVYLYSMVLGATGYLIVGKIPEGTNLIDNVVAGPLAIAVRVGVIVNLITSFSTILNPGRYCFLHAVTKRTQIHHYIWYGAGMAFLLVSYAFMSVTGIILTVIHSLAYATAPLLLVSLPTLLYFICFKFEHPVHGLASLILTILGVIASIGICAMQFM